MSSRWIAALALGVVVVAGAAGLAAGQGPAPTAPPAAPLPARPAREAPADLALVGVIVKEGDESIAIIADRRAQKQGTYRVGAVVGGARITAILPDRVRLVLADGEAELRLAGTPGGGTPLPPAAAPGPVVVVPDQPRPPALTGPPPPSDPRFQRVDRATIEHLLNAQELLTEVAPLEDPGVRVVDVKQGGLLQTLGLRKGDVIRSINGRPVGQAAPLSQAVEQAAQVGVIRVELERGGRMDVRYLQVGR